MNVRLSFSVDTSNHLQQIDELDNVALSVDCMVEGIMLRAGTIGTVISVYGSGEAFCVEFADDVIVDLSNDQIRAVPGERFWCCQMIVLSVCPKSIITY